jgi:hypothetical protein
VALVWVSKTACGACVGVGAARVASLSASVARGASVIFEVPTIEEG